MPELPEVETVVRGLRGAVIGRTITGFRNSWPRHIALPAPDVLRARLIGRTIRDLKRRAKYLVFDLSEDETLIIHLKMTGHLSVTPSDLPLSKHDHTVFELDNGQELRFRDARKFGKVYLTRDPDQVLGRLGPEPLAGDFDAAALAARLAGRRRALKPLLLEQSVLAGIGNIYADEALFEARLHPTRPADSLDAVEIARLHAAIQAVLRLGIAREGASIDSYVKPDGAKGDMQNAVQVFRRTGAPCYVCGTPIQRIVLGQRSTHFCPTCQPAPA